MNYNVIFTTAIIYNVTMMQHSVLVAAIVRKRTTIVAGRVELRPADDPEASDSRNIRQQTGRLLDIDAVLTLVPGYRLETRLISQLAQLIPR